MRSVRDPHDAGRELGRADLRTHRPATRPATRGSADLIVGLLALVTPHVLASGHGALFELFGPGRVRRMSVLITLFLKAAASVVSLGTGFRGGLFFASLYIGGMIGRVFFFASNISIRRWRRTCLVCTLVGMAALAVAVIGTPMAMSFLALETTGDFPLGLVMLAVASIVSIIVRRTFGYSFATWRLHLRGESIRSAQDVGWMRDLTAGRLMRTDVPKARLDMPIAAFMEEFPARSTNQWVVLTGPSGGYAGMAFVPDVHLAGVEWRARAWPVLASSRVRPMFSCCREMNIKLAMQIFRAN